MSAVRALVSPRNPRRIPWMRRESSSRNDQLEAPVSDDLSCQGGLQPFEDRLGAASQHRLPLPCQVVTEQPRRLHPVLSGQIAQGGEPPHGPGTEEIAAM